MKCLTYSLIFVSVVCFSCSNTEQSKHIGPHTESKELFTLPGLDHGLIQSPVNILTTQTGGATEHEITIIRPDSIKAADVVNTGHSIQLDFDPGAGIVFDGTEYHFLQAHFHTPSEHKVDGVTFPMEMHFVGMADPPEEGSNPQYLVIGAFFKMGPENKFIEAFINKIPESGNDTTLLNENPVYISDLFEKGEAFNDYFFYKGSLTTPPYTETVKWVITKKILEASPKQIQRINELEGNNARHVQALFKREIENN